MSARTHPKGHCPECGEPLRHRECLNCKDRNYALEVNDGE